MLQVVCGRCLGWNRVQASKSIKSQPDVYIFYGSQTGTTEGYAKRLAARAESRHVHAVAQSLSQFDVHKLSKYTKVIFMVASYGTGGPTDDAASFYSWLKTSLKPDLSTMQYTVFGCGNTDYLDTYNGMAKFVDAKVGAFGATRFYDLTLGDAAGEIDHLDNDYAEWEHKILDELAVPIAGSATAQPELATYAKVETPRQGIPEQRKSTTTLQAALYSPPSIPLISLQALSHTAIQVDVATDGPYTGTGILALYPQNALEIVQAVASRCGYDLSHWVPHEKTAPDSQVNIPLPCTVLDALTHYIDLCAVSRTILTALAPHATNPSEADNLRRIGSTDTAYAETIRTPRLSLLGVLRAFPSVQLSLASLLSIACPMKPRRYTIASSPAASPNVVQCCISVPENPLADLDHHNGTMGACLVSLLHASRTQMPPPAVRFRGSHQSSTFSFPESHDAPVILIAAGSGIAPMRAIWQDRNEAAKRGEPVGKTTLFFGCRDADGWLYRRELENLAPLRVECRIAYSRQPGQAKKEYVQDVVGDHLASILVALDTANAYIYVCGKINMAQEVQTLLKRDRDATWWEAIVASHRYNQEVFG